MKYFKIFCTLIYNKIKTQIRVYNRYNKKETKNSKYGNKKIQMRLEKQYWHSKNSAKIWGCYLNVWNLGNCKDFDDDILKQKQKNGKKLRNIIWLLNFDKILDKQKKMC